MKFEEPLTLPGDETTQELPAIEHKPKWWRRKGLVIPMVAVLLLAIAGAGYWVLYGQESDDKTTPSVSAGNEDAEEPKEARVSFAAMGDMLAHDSVMQNAKTNGSYDFTKYFSGIRDSYSDADVVFCNQEGLSAGESFGISGYPTFNAPKEFSRDLKNGAGCNLINLANNHIGDKGQAAIDATLDNWDELKPYAVAGANRNAAEQQQVRYFTVNNVKIAFLAFADFSNNKGVSSYGLNIYHDTALVSSLVNEARANADAVIVSMHWGVEDSTEVSADQYSAAQILSSLGVDVIIGTGPHVLQKVDWLTNAEGKETLVWYSLGNMLSSQLAINELTGGVAVFDVVKNADGKGVTVEAPKFTPTYMHYEWTAAQKAAEDLLARTNLNLYLLKNAEQPLSRSLHGVSAIERLNYVKTTLGSDATVVE